jgi:uncharacterized protein (DUF433 family)
MESSIGAAPPESRRANADDAVKALIPGSILKSALWDCGRRKYLILAVSIQCGYGSEMSERVEINPRVCGGQPVIKGTRISVAAILEQLAEDESWDKLLRGYPELTRVDIQASLEYARHSILHTEITALYPA